MSKVTRFTCFFFGGAVATVLSACDVQVHDATPDQYPANHDVGMYEIKATVVPRCTGDARVGLSPWCERQTAHRDDWQPGRHRMARYVRHPLSTGFPAADLRDLEAAGV